MEMLTQFPCHKEDDLASARSDTSPLMRETPVGVTGGYRLQIACPLLETIDDFLAASSRQHTIKKYKKLRNEAKPSQKVPGEGFEPHQPNLAPSRRFLPDAHRYGHGLVTR